MRHMGLSNDNCGIRARFVLPTGSADSLGPDLQVLAGESADRAQSPLRIAATVTDRLREHALPLTTSGSPGA